MCFADTSSRFSAKVDRLAAAYFSAQGLDALYHGGADLLKDYGGMEPKQVFGWVTATFRTPSMR